MRRVLLIALWGLPAACGGAEFQAAQRVELDDARPVAETPLDSPDTGSASWQPDPAAHAIRFGPAGRAPLLSLHCDPQASPEPMLAIVRHARAYPGRGVIMPVIGNGERSRFLADPARVAETWQWQVMVPASDPRLAVFAGGGELRATVPGAGTVIMAGSALPGWFVRWCRARGQLPGGASDLAPSPAPG